MIEERKKTAAYQVSLSAVKKTQNAKRGMDKIKQTIPEITNHFESYFNNRIKKSMKKNKSCNFI